MADNTITVVGNVTRDPEIRYTPNGQANANFGVAVNRRWMNRQTNEWEERTSFFNVVCWREMAENVCESIWARARGWWSPAGSSSAAGRPRTARSAASSRSSPTTSVRACGSRPPRSRRSTAAVAATSAAVAVVAAAEAEVGAGAAAVPSA